MAGTANIRVMSGGEVWSMRGDALGRFAAPSPRVAVPLAEHRLQASRDALPRASGGRRVAAW
jgi:hypothetical protein